MRRLYLRSIRRLGIAPSLLACGCCLWQVMVARAQQPPPVSGIPVPRLFSVSPGGGKIGSTLELTFTGSDIENPHSLVFSHPGIKAEPIVPPAPPAPPVDPKKPKP